MIYWFFLELDLFSRQALRPPGPESGIASVYNGGGHPASGEQQNPNALTAAHRTARIVRQHGAGHQQE